jgi:hypothetical protein
MQARARIKSRTALAALLAAGLASPLAASAGDPIDCKLEQNGKIQIKTVDSPQACKRLGGKQIPRHYCELRKAGGKLEIKPIPTPQDCLRLGGKVVKKPRLPRGSRSQRPLT